MEPKKKKKNAWKKSTDDDTECDLFQDFFFLKKENILI